jgi:hypothetical protein
MLMLWVALSGCWGPTWPHQGMSVNLARAQATREEVAKVASDFLQLHGLRDAGKAGQDLVNKTSTVLNFRSADGLYVSIFLNRREDIPISFDEDKPSFSDAANTLFDELFLFLSTKWPDAVKIDSPRTSNDRGAPKG